MINEVTGQVLDEGMPGFQKAYAQALAIHLHGQGSRVHERNSSIRLHNRPQTRADRAESRAQKKVWGVGTRAGSASDVLKPQGGTELTENPITSPARRTGSS